MHHIVEYTWLHTSELYLELHNRSGANGHRASGSAIGSCPEPDPHRSACSDILSLVITRLVCLRPGVGTGDDEKATRNVLDTGW